MDELNLARLIALVAFAGTYLGLALGRLPIFASTGPAWPSSAGPSSW